MSELRTDLVSNRLGNGPASLRDQWAAKQRVNFNGTGTVAIRDSNNTSSVIDGGVGIFTVNFTAGLADANFTIAGFANYGPSGSPAGLLTAGSAFAPTSSSAPIFCGDAATGAFMDPQHAHMQATR